MQLQLRSRTAGVAGACAVVVFAQRNGGRDRPPYAHKITSHHFAGVSARGRPVRVRSAVLVCRAEATSTAVSAPPAADSSELQKYGVFKLSYNTANVRGRGAALPDIDARPGCYPHRARRGSLGKASLGH
jgi:hypothetical protein